MEDAHGKEDEVDAVFGIFDENEEAEEDVDEGGEEDGVDFEGKEEHGWNFC